MYSLYLNVKIVQSLESQPGVWAVAAYGPGDKELRPHSDPPVPAAVRGNTSPRPPPLTHSHTVTASPSLDRPKKAFYFVR